MTRFVSERLDKQDRTEFISGNERALCTDAIDASAAAFYKVHQFQAFTKATGQLLPADEDCARADRSPLGWIFPNPICIEAPEDPDLNPCKILQHKMATPIQAARIAIEETRR